MQKQEKLDKQQGEKKHQKKETMSKHNHMADGRANVLSRWLIIISYGMRSTVHHWVRLIHNMLDSMRIFTSARSISWYTPYGGAWLTVYQTAQKLKLTHKKIKAIE